MYSRRQYDFQSVYWYLLQTFLRRTDALPAVYIYSWKRCLFVYRSAECGIFSPLLVQYRVARCHGIAPGVGRSIYSPPSLSSGSAGRKTVVNRVKSSSARCRGGGWAPSAPVLVVYGVCGTLQLSKSLYTHSAHQLDITARAQTRPPFRSSVCLLMSADNKWRANKRIMFLTFF